MNVRPGFQSSNRKIDPARRRATQIFKPDGTPLDPDRVEIGPTDVAFAEWDALGLTPPDVPRMRVFRHARIVAEINRRGLAGALLYDPLNLRYASDSSNMHVWILHNPARACFVGADGHMIVWDYNNCEFLNAHLPLVKEVRQCKALFYFSAGDAQWDKAREFAAEIADVVARHGGGDKRIAVDKMELHGAAALENAGLEVVSGQELMEHVRLIKGPDEINAMRCAMATCEIAMAEMEKQAVPGIAETELWAILHKENIARGGEWIETRILASGPRTNPWFQEAGPRKLQDGDLLAYDTDLIGPYGMCADLSRTVHVGDGEPTAEQREVFEVAYDHIMTNMELLKPGVLFSELTHLAKPLPEAYRHQRYSCCFHGVGLCDEFPCVTYPEDFREGAMDYPLEPGMMLCVECYAGKVGGRDGVKLEDQVLITEDGFENLTKHPFDPKLLP
ncbi:MAG: dimethylsulfonioproprionate lyase DddP [Pseudomonadota bacterium]